MAVYIVRHGESLANVHSGLRLQPGYATITDDRVPLSEWGYEQASAAGVALAGDLAATEREGRKIKIIYSPYLRTSQTCRGILRKFASTENLAAVTDRHMVEQNFGWFTCMGDNDTIRSVWPEELEAFLYDKGIDRHNAKAPEGESRADVVERARHVVERHRADFEDPNTDVILIGHGVINRAMEMCLRGEGEEWFHATKNPNNCDVHKLEGNLGIGYAPTECIHESKLRPKTLPQYKAEPYGEDKVLMR